MGQPTPFDLTLFELKVFVRAGRSRSLRETARDLGLRPAHVSKLVGRVESRLGHRLFRRSAGGVELEPEALAFLRAAEDILGRAEALSGGASMPQAKDMVRASPLAIGAVSFLQSSVIVPALARLSHQRRGARAAPPRRFRIVETPREELVSQGIAGAFEIAVHLGALEWPRSWASKRVAVTEYALYARSGHALATSGTQVAAQAVERDVLRYPFVLPTYWVKQKLSSGSDLCPVSPERRLWGDETTTATTALEIVSRSDQLAYLPRVVAKEAVERGDAREIVVAGWRPVAREVIVSVRAEAVSQVLFRAFCAEVARACP